MEFAGKKLILAATVAAAGMFGAGAAASAAALTAGSIAIVRYQATNPDNFSFVALDPIASGQVIYFTDNGYLANASGGTQFRNSEGILQYTAPSAIAAGTVINTADTTSFSTPTTPFSAPFSGSTSNFSFNASGDQLFAYTSPAAPTNGTIPTTVTLLYGITTNRSTWDADATNASTSAQPSSLVGASVALGQASAPNADAVYTGSTTGTKAALLAAISNNANWSKGTYNATTNPLTPPALFTISSSTASYTVPATLSLNGVLLNAAGSYSATENATSSSSGTFSASASGAGFSVTPTSGTGTSATLTVSYTGTATAGVKSGTITVTPNTGGSNSTAASIVVGQTTADNSNSTANFGPALTANVSTLADLTNLQETVTGNTAGTSGGAGTLKSTLKIIKGISGSVSNIAISARARTLGEQIGVGPGFATASDIFKVSFNGSVPTYILEITENLTIPNPNIGQFVNGNWQALGTHYVGDYSSAASYSVGDYGISSDNGGSVFVVTNKAGIFAVVPEPASLGLLAAGSLSLVARRRRRA